MKMQQWGRRATLIAVCGLAVGVIGARLSAADREVTPDPVLDNPKIMKKPPKGAIMLYSGKAEDLKNNFYERYSKNEPGWTVDANGVATPNKHDIVSKQEFGDLYVHVEFHEPVDAQGNRVGEGNSGVGLQGRYEVQILDSYGKANPGPEDCGAFYSQKAPLVNALKKPTEWQTYDIWFRAPRLDDAGNVTAQPRATVVLNGIVIQKNQEFNGPTGIQYGELKGQPKTGPLILQGDHDPVQFRSCWVVPLK